MAIDDIVMAARTWIGTPYIHQASAKGAGCDCLGLLRGVWRELHGSEPEAPPPYTPDWAEAAGRETLYMACRRHLAEVATGALRSGDVALFRMARSGPAKHCGVFDEKVDLASLIQAHQSRKVTEELLTPYRRGRFAFGLQPTW